jgi:hypothetical protein
MGPKMKSSSRRHVITDNDASERRSSIKFAPPDMVKFGWIQKLLMRDLWSEDHGTVFAALRELADLSLDDERAVKDRASVYAAGGHFSIIAAMNKWYTNREIVIDGLRALANIGANPEFRDSVVASCGGFEVVLLAMRNFPADEYVQRIASACLNLFCLDPYEHATKFVLELEGHELEGLCWLVAALKNFPHNLRLQNFGISTLFNLSDHEAFQYPIVEAGGMIPLDFAAEEFENSKDNLGHDTYAMARVTLNRLMAD